MNSKDEVLKISHNLEINLPPSIHSLHPGSVVTVEIGSTVSQKSNNNFFSFKKNPIFIYLLSVQSEFDTYSINAKFVEILLIHHLQKYSFSLFKILKEEEF